MAPITKLVRKVEAFEWTIECQIAWEDINNQYIQAPILINLTMNWNFMFTLMCLS